MTQLSRVKKYENLRKEIENEKSVSGIKTELTDTKSLHTTKEIYTPAHKKSFNLETPVENNSESSFKNEYLDSFIQEVRQYNIQKGIRESEDTKLDILQQLSSKNRERRSNYLSQIEETIVEEEPVEENVVESLSQNEQTMEISRQIFELINEDKVEDEVEKEVVEVPSSLEEKIAALEKEVSENGLEEKEVVSQTAQLTKPVLEKEEISEITKKELMERTMELKATVDSYKEELSEMNSDISNNNKLLNVIIVILVLALLGVIGVVIYWLFAGGIL